LPLPGALDVTCNGHTVSVLPVVLARSLDAA
jgi:hypothetical protein